ncbi:MAG: NAD-dependent epimerase/dehydratase family protein [Dehalococcoidales bacterium]|nr:NAD-dependent epimerase/dehydratase family protein [Dehalococcoidales bacterium]
MTVAITGASGHIGANLVRSLLSAGRPVRCLVHVHCRAIDGLDVETVPGDIQDVESLCRAFEGAEVVYHLAARISLSMKDWPSVEAVNVTGTRNVVEACLRTGVRRLIHFGSIHALVQEPIHIPLDEERPLSLSPPGSPYDRSKAMGIQEVRKGIERGLNAIIILPTGVLGPNDFEPSFFGQALLSMAQGRLPALVTGGFDWVDARDVVTGTLTAEAKAPAGAMYLLPGHWVSMPDIARMIEEITGIKAPRCTVPLWLARLGAPAVEAWGNLRNERPLYTRMSLSALHSNQGISRARAARELGYEPREFRESLADTLQWFRENGMLDYAAASRPGGTP